MADLFVDTFQHKCWEQPDTTVVTWLGESGQPEEKLTYSQLAARAAAVAGFLSKKLKLGKGDRVILSFPPGLKFLVTFVACISRGIIAVPVYPPAPGTFKRDLDRLQLIARTAGALNVLTTEDYHRVMTALKWKDFFTSMGGFADEFAKWRVIPPPLFRSARAASGAALDAAELVGEDVAFLQFTSGSTGDPKGVMVTHGNLAHNLATMLRGITRMPEGGVCVSWMPQYHDFGLIVMMLAPLFAGYSAVLMSPFTFLKNPLIWLEVITRYGGNLTAAPNFAYARCVKAFQKLPQDRQPRLDLSSLKYCMNGAEPIRPAAVEAFRATFAPFGFSPTAMVPSYGLAEHVVYGVCYFPGGLVVDSGGFVAVGRVGQDHDIDILIMAPEGGRVCSEGETGEIWLHSPSMAAGYWGRPDATQATFQNSYQGKHYLRTGDLAYVKDGLLYITGRLKDVVVVAGRNIYPQDIELTVEKVSPEIRPGCVAAFQLYTGLGAVGGEGPEDHVGVVAEVRSLKLTKQQLSAIFLGIRQVVTAEHGVNAVHIALVKQRTIPKTTSGKIRRSTCREMLLAGKLTAIPGGMYKNTDPPQLPSDEAPGTGVAAALGSARALMPLNASSSKVLLGKARPADPLTAEVMDIIAGVTGLGFDALSPELSLVELGIGSLQAIEIGSQLEDKYCISLDSELLFSGCSLTELIEQLSGLLQKQTAETRATPAPGAKLKQGASSVKAAQAEASHPASFNQQQMFIVDSAATCVESRIAYNIPAALELRGCLDLGALSSALEQLCARHAVLRSHFAMEGGELSVVYCPAAEFEVPFVQQQVAASNGSLLDDAAVKAAVEQEARVPFDLLSGPLVRFTLLEVSAEAHVLVMVMHHSISDGWSVRVLLGDLAELYNASVKGAAPKLPSTHTTYAEYAAWQRSQDGSGAWDAGINYWKRQLASVTVHLPLPYTSNSMLPVRAGPGADIKFAVPAEVVGKLAALAARHGTTLNSVLMAALGALLMRYSNEEDICIGGGSACRTSEHLHTAGMFSNLILQRLAVGGDLHFDELVEQVKAVVKAAAEHSYVPYEIVHNKALRGSGISFPVFMVLQDYRLMAAPSLEGLQCELNFDIALGAAQFDQFWELVTMPDGGIQARLSYSSLKFSSEAAAMMTTHFTTLLAAAATQPEQTVAGLCLLTPQDQQLLGRFSSGPLRPDYLEQPLLPAAFEANAAACPDHPCLVYKGEALTYGQVNARANALAAHLAGLGVSANRPVGVMLDRGFDLLTSFLAVMKAGGCYVPLDPAYPDDRLAIYLEDAASTVLLTTAAHAERAAALAGSSSACHTVLLEDFWAGCGDLKRAVPPPVHQPSPDDLAYILFTSGSTGRPKGVMVRHRGLRDLMCFLRDNFGLTPQDASIMSTSVSFDAHVFQSLSILYAGGRLVIGETGRDTDGDYIAGLIADQGVTFMLTVPILGYEYFKSSRAADVKHLRTIVYGADKLPEELVRLTLASVPSKPQIFNAYGPTEVTVTAASALLDPSDLHVHIGRPETNCHAYIVDSALRAVPPGVAGELLLSGPRVAAGYVGQPDLTAERFIPNPLFPELEGSLPEQLQPYFRIAYRTGDLVRWRPDGSIDLLGRIDRQVKVNGVRIELGEVEGVLAKAPGVELAVVKAVPDPSGSGKRLVGYVAPASVDPAAAINHCRASLIPAMVPSVVVPLNNFPLLPNGKIDVNGLPAPAWEEAAVDRTPPATPLEEQLQAIWTKALGSSEPIGVLTDFFAAGGTSLMVIKLTAAMQSALGIPQIPSTLVYNERTVRATAAALSDLIGGSGAVPGALPPILPRSWSGSVRPLSANQEQMWLLDTMGPAAAYQMPMAMKLEGSVNSSALQKALDLVAARHEVLRMRYAQQGDGNMAAVVQPASSFSVPLELCQLAPGESLEARLAAEVSSAFDLTRGPLLHVKLLLAPKAPAPASSVSTLLVTVHHAVGDALSFDIFLADLAAAYNACLAGAAPAWDPLPVQYADFAAWQQEQLAGEAAAQQREYWRSVLSGCPDVIQLPLDRPRPAEPTFKGGSVTASLGRDLMQRLQAVAHSLGVNLQALLLAGLQVLLLRYSGQEDVVVGVPMAGRDDAATHGLIGYFINTVPIRCHADKGGSFADMARATSAAVLQGLENSLLPFQQVVEALGGGRASSAGVNPLFQVMFQYLPDAAFSRRPKLEGLKVVSIGQAAPLPQAKLDLFFSLDATGEVSVEYMAELFDQSTVQRMVAAYKQLLCQVAQQPEQPAAGLRLFTEHDRQLLAPFLSGLLRPDYLQGPLVPAAFEAHAAAHPDRPCLVFEGHVLTYGQVNARANALAHRLVALGVAANVSVGVMLDRSFDLVIAIMATLKAGGVYVPLDPSFPDDRLAIYMEDAAAAVLLTQKHHVQRAQKLGGANANWQTVCMEEFWGSSPKLDAPNLPADRASLDSLAYIIFTSGSTGRPKGVMINHGGLLDFVRYNLRYYEVTPADASLLSITINFDAHIFQLFTPLVAGARLVIARPEGHADAAYLVRLMEETGVTLFMTVPALGLEYYRQPGAQQLTKLRGALFIGEPLPLELVELIYHNVPKGVVVYNTYGPTEATVTATNLLCPDGLDHMTIGFPEDNMHCYVVDDCMNPTPAGVPGELLLSGPRLAAGYIGRPDLTTDRFIDNPCNAEVEASLPPELRPYFLKAYRTGDLVRWRADGSLDCLGRVDRQVKVNGVRIEVGEVEGVLAKAPGVEQAVVKAVPDPSGSGKRLIGYVTPASVDTAGVVAHGKGKLIPAMVPSAILALDTFPLLPNGKIDVNGLPAPAWEEAAVDRTPPATPLEEQLQVIWTKALGSSEPIGVLTDFFVAGGTSLKVLQVNAAMQSALGLDSVPVTLIFSQRTIRATAAELGKLSAGGIAAGPAALQPILPRSWEGDTRPLSANQEQMWVLNQFGGSSAYNMIFALRLEGNVNTAALQQGLKLVANRHEVLRMHYAQQQDGSVSGVIQPASSFSVPLEICPLAAGDSLDELLAAEVGMPFDLCTGPLIRAKLFRPAGKSGINTLAVAMQHAVGDAWSTGVFLTDLAAAYSACLAGAAPAWDLLPLQYADYAVWQQEQLAGEAAAQQREYWRSALSGCPDVIQLPLDRPRPAMPSFAASRSTLPLGAELMGQLKGVAASLGVNMQALLVAALQVLLLRYSGQEDVVVGVPIAGRDSPATLGLMGYFVNSVAVRGTASEGATFVDMARAASASIMHGLENSMLPFQQVVEALQVRRQSGVNPIFQVMFQHLPDAADLPLRFDGLNASLLEGTGPSEAKLDLYWDVDASGLVIIDYMAELFDGSTVQRMAAAYQLLLRQVAQQPEQPAAGLRLFTEHDRQLLAPFLSGLLRPDYLQGPLVPAAFEAHAATHPDRPCLVFEGQVLTYGQVNARANALAHRLVALGVAANVSVGVMLDRSFDLVIAIMATLKAGGVYVPLDPSFPDDRLAIYMEDAAAAVLLTQKHHVQRAQQLGGANANWQTVCMEEFWGSSPKLDAPNLPADRASLDSLAYIIFTSGSTGRPKGVMINHGGLLDFVCYNLRYYEVTPADASLLSITINFDAHIFQLFTPLVAGARLVIARPEGHADAAYLVRLMEETGVTLFMTVPALGLEYYRQPGTQQLKKLRGALFIGEPLPLELVELIYRNVPKGVVVYNTYGPTEATVTATNLLCPDGLDHMTIGFPEDNMHCYVVDDCMNPTPAGVPGELLLSGPRLAAGYIGRPDLTADRFIDNPCYAEVEASLPPELRPYFLKAYRTGDLVRWRADGSLDCLGRVDRQVKVNGVRIELGEVEGALAKAPGVEQAVVKAVPDPSGSGKRLIGYVTPASVDTAGVVAHCKGKLIPAMVPSAILALDTFPLLPNGKIDVNGLPAPAWEEAAVERTPPATPLEEQLQSIWTKALGSSEPIGVLTDFFVAGGTSLKVLQVNAAMQSALGLNSVPVTLIFSQRTIRATAAELGKLSAGGIATGPAALQPILPRSWEGDTRPLSANQEQMWVLNQFGGSSAYNMIFALRLEGNVNTAALQQGLNMVANRHEVLRMHYAQQQDGSVSGVIQPASSFSVPLEICSLSTGDNLEQLLSVELGKPFDLLTGPLIRAKLFQPAGVDGSCTLAVAMQHAVGDAWSTGVFLTDLAAAYSACLAGAAPAWDLLPVQYSDYAAWQREQLAGEAAAQQREYWRSTLAGCPDVIQLPLDHPRPAAPTFASGRRSFPLGEELMGQLKGVAASLGVNMQALLVAALQVLLLRYSGQEDVVVGIPMAGRDSPTILGLMGYFVNTVAVRGTASEGATFADMARAASSAVLHGLENSLLPFQQVVEALEIRRQSGINPIFQVIFQHLPDAADLQLHFDGLNASLLPDSAPSEAKLDLFWDVDASGLVTVDYMAELFDGSTIERMLAAYQLILQQAAQQPQRAMATLRLLTEQDRQLLSRLSSGPLRPDYLEQPLMPAAFEELAAAQPGRPCLVFGDEVLTYGEVNLRANALAHELVHMGVGPNTFVGVMLDRSNDLLLSFLAIMKAGGCYVPLDVCYPNDRLANYLEDCEAAVLISSASHAHRANALAGNMATWETMLLEDFWESCDLSKPVHPPATSLSPDDLAYIIFTSGSTGRPKGAMVRHRGLLDLVCFWRDFYQLGPYDVSLFSCSVNFDAHIYQTFAVLYAGGSIVTTRNNGETDIDYVMQTVQEQGVTFFGTVPTLGWRYIESPYTRGCTKLRIVIYAGEALPMELVEATVAELPQLPGCYNLYGPTEVTVGVFNALIRPGGSRVPLGCPDTNVHAYVVGADLSQVPVGVPGELLLSGPRLGAGYVGRPDLTADKFIPNPFYAEFEAALPPSLRPHYQLVYRTGDLVCMRVDGTVDYLGRIDRQVKVNGVRIELGEVEGVLAKAPGVAQAVAKAVPAPFGAGKRLVGYVTPASVDPAAAIAHCRASLIPAMVPSVVVPLEAFPLLPNGKTDTNSLPPPDWERASEEEYVEPGNDLERAVQSIWMQVLRIDEPISATADFFHIGGTSLNAGQINAAVRKELGIDDLPATLLYDSKTIQEFATAIQAHCIAGGAARQKYRAEPTQRLAGGHTRKIFFKSSAFLEKHATMKQQARLSAEDLHLEQHMPSSVPATKLPYWLYMVLQLVTSLGAVLFVPLMMCTAIALTLVWYGVSGASNMQYGAYLCIPFGLAAYLAALLGAALWLLAFKWVFLGRLQPGVHPLFGWTYLRWVSYQSMARAVMPWVGFYMRRTRLLAGYYRLLGAHIQEGVILDTYQLMDPDLISIGAGSTLAENVVVSAAFVAPAGFADKVGCLIFSTTRIGTGCILGRMAIMPAGARLHDGHSLKPYQTPAMHQAVVKGDMPDYPQFLPERHLTPGWQLAASLTFTALSLLLLTPGIMAAVFILLRMYGIQGNEILGLLSDGKHGVTTDAVVKVSLLPLAIIFLINFVVTPVGVYMQTGTALLFKHLVLGKLSPGLHLTGSQYLLARYYIFKRLLEGYFYATLRAAMFGTSGLGSLNSLFGAKMHPTSRIRETPVEFDAITVGAGVVPGGRTHFQCVGSDGVIRSVFVGDYVNVGHTGMYAGCRLEAGCIVGNETSAAAGQVIPPGARLQGQVEYKGTAAAAPGQAVDLEAGTGGAAAAAPEATKKWRLPIPRVVLANLMYNAQGSLNLFFTWGLAAHLDLLAQDYKGYIAVLVFAIPVLTIGGLLLTVLMTRLVFWLSRSKEVFKRSSIPGNDVRMLWMELASVHFQLTLDAFRGTPWYSLLAAWAGWRVDRRALLFCLIPLEQDLWEVKAAMLDWDVRAVPHWIENGEYFFKHVTVEDGAWVQIWAHCVGAPRLARMCRVLPGTMVMPNEEIGEKTAWGGIPGNPVAKVVTARTPSNSRRSVRDLRSRRKK